MARLCFTFAVLSMIVAFSSTANQDSINKDLVNTRVQRTLELSSHLPKITTTVTLLNLGKTSVRSFLFAVDAELYDRLSFIGALTKTGDDEQKLTVAETSVVNHKDKNFYRVELSEPVDAGKDSTVEVETVFAHSLRPYPSQITQAEKQNVQFEANAHFYSPYKTVTQTTTANLPSDKTESYSEVPKPVAKSDSTVTYGPYENVEPFSQEAITLHYENNNPFLTVTELERVLEVSHWGNIAVEETVDVKHTGALLKGPFSRYEYQRNQDGVSSVKSFKTVLPASARDVYYRDEIGNISTSNLKELDDMVELELRPRFPLFGGWKTHYYIGYNVPSYQYLYNRGDHYMLKMRFVDHILDDQIVDHMTLKVILPEGAEVLKLVTPYEVTRNKEERHYTYLDTVGRPVVVATKDNLVEGHIQDFELHYSFKKVMMLQEPLLVIGAFYLLFVTVIIYVRLDFSITKDEASESRMRVAGLIEQIQGVQDRRSALYQSYDDAINKYKSAKDSGNFTNSKKKIDADHKSLTQQMQALVSKLKADSSEVAEKVAELQKLDSAVKEQVNLAIQSAEKLIAGKMTKQNYVENENNIKAKKEDLYQKMDNILAAF